MCQGPSRPGPLASRRRPLVTSSSLRHHLYPRLARVHLPPLRPPARPRPPWARSPAPPGSAAPRLPPLGAASLRFLHAPPASGRRPSCTSPPGPADSPQLLGAAPPRSPHPRTWTSVWPGSVCLGAFSPLSVEARPDRHCHSCSPTFLRPGTARKVSSRPPSSCIPQPCHPLPVLPSCSRQKSKSHASVSLPLPDALWARWPSQGCSLHPWLAAGPSDSPLPSCPSLASTHGPTPLPSRASCYPDLPLSRASLLPLPPPPPRALLFKLQPPAPHHQQISVMSPWTGPLTTPGLGMARW